MKQILIAFDGNNFSKGAMDMAVQINQLVPIHITGAFIPQVDYRKLWNFSGADPGIAAPMIGSEHSAEVEQNIKTFENICEQHRIKYSIKKDYLGFALPELKKETRFNDVLFLGGESFFSSHGDDMNDYIREALNQSECPILVIPEDFLFPRSIILAYDGTASSVYAIKQFAYLFPELCNQSALLVYSDDKGEGIPDQEDIALLSSLHFPNLQLIKLDADPEKEFKEWISEKRRSLLVTGSFGRGLFSQLFRKSFVSEILQQHLLPVFIAHK
ncbi:MAG: universal stress protein [Flavisolibacter sp.]|jgi:hypothetical protein|nr:universal stress protein [Flavisolibacter sp.]